MSPKRVPVVWIDPPQAPDFYLGKFPVNFWQLPLSEGAREQDFLEIYALPSTVPGGRVKVAVHNRLADGEPDSMVGKILPGEMATIRQFLGDFIPSLKYGGAATDLCFYTMTPDRDFILGPLPGHSHVLTVALAGHGFKFAPVLGEILADLALDTAPPFDVSMFDIGRFANSNIQQ